MIRTKGEAGTGNVVEAVRHCRAVMGDIRRLCAMDEDEVFVYAKEIRAPARTRAANQKARSFARGELRRRWCRHPRLTPL